LHHDEKQESKSNTDDEQSAPEPKFSPEAMFAIFPNVHNMQKYELDGPPDRATDEELQMMQDLQNYLSHKYLRQSACH